MVKKMILEDLAVMVQKGFAETATKKELEEFRQETHQFQTYAMGEFDRVRSDIRDIKAYSWAACTNSFGNGN